MLLLELFLFLSQNFHCRFSFAADQDSVHKSVQQKYSATSSCCDHVKRSVSSPSLYITWEERWCSQEKWKKRLKGKKIHWMNFSFSKFRSRVKFYEMETKEFVTSMRCKMAYFKSQLKLQLKGVIRFENGFL